MTCTYPLVIITALVCMAPRAQACYWDRDTLAQEKRRFPGIAELLAGKFVRHSQAYYRWRVADRTAKLQAKPNDLALLDDLGVAQDKLGMHKKAIALARRALKSKPGRYETLANLATFYFHSGALTKGLRFVKEAIRINPKAHFGREIVQQRLVEYLIAVRKKRGKRLPLAPSWQINGKTVRIPVELALRRFAKRHVPPSTPYLAPVLEPQGFLAVTRRHKLDDKAAVRGIVGMLRFGQHRSPVLLEALGDVLFGGSMHRRDAKRLAARAFLAASYATKDAAARRLYRAKAALALAGHKREWLARVEPRFKRELARGARYFARIVRDEKRWIAAKRDVDALFARKYYRKRRKVSRKRR